MIGENTLTLYYRCAVSGRTGCVEAVPTEPVSELRREIAEALGYAAEGLSLAVGDVVLSGTLDSPLGSLALCAEDCVTVGLSAAAEARHQLAAFNIKGEAEDFRYLCMGFEPCDSTVPIQDGKEITDDPPLYRQLLEWLLALESPDFSVQHIGGYGPPFAMAISYRNTLGVKELLRLGAPLEQRTRDGTALQVAVEEAVRCARKENDMEFQRALEVIDILVKAGAEVDMTPTAEGSVLMLWSYWEDIPASAYPRVLELVRFLIERGAPVNKYEKGVSEEHPGGHFSEILAGAVRRDQVEIARLLIAHGARIGWPTSDSRSLLYMAASCSSLAMVKLLVECGPDLRVEDYETAWEIAKSNQGADRDRILDCLLKQKDSRRADDDVGKDTV
eukprot:TRINITY_DN2418_c0_g1_i1.p1 TRINITY_DN2418_c0_g1~~TRINITY_DN2418_c0_g1_i1.p1  ORF type:complete len:404 (+),score=-8.89 TRINITY_DN2418_c0_g1_i1:48-1214(+)